MPAWCALPPEITSFWTFLLLGSLAVMLISLAKAGFGGTLSLLAMPLMIYACGGSAMRASAILLPVLIAADYFALVSWWGKWELRAVALLLPGTMLGIAAGWAGLAGLQRMDRGAHGAADAGLMLGVGCIALGFVAIQIVKSLRARPLAFSPGLWQGTCVGAAAGFTSTLAHAAGPVVTMYMLPQQMPKAQYAASTVLFYWIGNQVKLIPYFALGLIAGDSLFASLLLLPAVAGGVALGVFLHHRLGQRQFTGIVYVLLALAGVQLILDALRKFGA